MFCTAQSLGLKGISAYKVSVETAIFGAYSGFNISGLNPVAAKDVSKRVQSAIVNCGYEFPNGSVNVSLLPNDTIKDGSAYDLPILLSILKADNQIRNDFSSYSFIGSISPEGEILPVTGILPMILEAKNLGIDKVFIPKSNAFEGSVARGIKVFAAKNITEVIDHIAGKKKITALKSGTMHYGKYAQSDLDFADITGQYEAKRALEIAAAGFHNVILIGPPGAGKSMLAKRIPSILPEMTLEEALEVTKIHSVCGTVPKDSSLLLERPFRAPHHKILSSQLIGGATQKPGEISLAHGGVLFLDELPEYNRTSMEALRRPLEQGKVAVAPDIIFPCSTMLVTAMNPCPCGYYGHPVKKCVCSESSISKYLAKVSGPILDRIDIHVEVMPIEFIDIGLQNKEESSVEIRKRVNAARKIQNERYKGTGITANAMLTPDLIGKYCAFSEETREFITTSMEKMGISERGFEHIAKVSRTIADLDESKTIEIKHIAEALQYRNLDRKYWGN